jgi:anti-anti-sigma factor
MPESLEVTPAAIQGRTEVLRVRGRLDARTVPLLMERASAVQASGLNLVLNLAEVTFIGSSGVGSILVLVEQFQEQGGSVRLASLSAPVASVLALLNLDQFLTIDPNEEASLAALDS